MKVACVYHKVDCDGWMSAAIVQTWAERCNELGRETEVEYYGYDYGDNTPDFENCDMVIMCDVTFPVKNMERLFHRFGTKFIWVDHHARAIAEVGKKIETNFICGRRSAKYAACELAWATLFSPVATGLEESMSGIPEVVRLLGMYDSYRHGNDIDVLKFQYYARSVIYSREGAYDMLSRELRSEPEYVRKMIGSMVESGGHIYKFLCVDAKKKYERTVPVTFKLDGAEYKFGCANDYKFNPENFGINYADHGYDGYASFFFENGKWNFSLYSCGENAPNCAEIAATFGGGGHYNAAGFRVSDISQILRVI